ncbi:MAG: hypothetical protein HYT15_01630 [Candidatus Magasanikbacteria bacterium]|nr:hypothetical protein [Candidatus Magasanikbacteria bacterium]
MKKLAIYFSNPKPMGDPFDLRYPYWQIYKEIIRNVEKQGIDVYVTRAKDSYLGKGVFTHGWKVDGKQLIEINEQITVDLIFHRGSQATIPATYDCPIINHPDLERFCGDKIKVNQVFADISPKTKAINSYQEYRDTIKEWNFNPEDKIVVKKNFLYGGHGVYIRPIKEITESLYENWRDILMQEFVDSSGGIPGIVEGLHDIRVVTINGEPVYSFVRTPPVGSFLANVSQGGAEKAVPLSQLPAELLQLVERVNKELAQYRPSIFASDFFNSKNGFKLIELNSRPAVCDPAQSPETRNYIDKIIQLLVNTINNSFKMEKN